VRRILKADQTLLAKAEKRVLLTICWRYPDRRLVKAEHTVCRFGLVLAMALAGPLIADFICFSLPKLLNLYCGL
jgi:hypothetical protein